MIKRFLKVCVTYYVPFWTVLVVAVVAFVYFFGPDQEIDVGTIRLWAGLFATGMWLVALVNAPDRYRGGRTLEDEQLGMPYMPDIPDDEEQEIRDVIRKARRWFWVSGFGAGLLTAQILELWVFNS